MTAPMRRSAVQGCACAVAIISVLSFAPAAQEPPQPQPEQPRFRAGANLVRIDAYVSQNGEAVPDLQAEDFEVLEDGVPQKIESFEIIRARPPVSQAARAEPNTVAESRAMAANSEARLFVLFMDVWHVHLEGSYRAQGPITNLLDRLIGQDDLIGVMTPEMSARNLTLARRTTTIDGIFRQNWFWGQRQRLVTDDPREQELQLCYPDTGETANIAQELIDRRRERKTLDAIEDLIIHLEGIREERKFVILLSEGWRLPRRDDRLGRTIGNNVPRTPPVGVGVDGRLTTGPPTGTQDFERCERERLRLAAEDLEQDFRTLLQRANRANVSFYTVDPRGLAVFDEDLSLRRATNISADRAMLQSRQTALRELAENTDGVAVVNTSDLDGALRRALADIGLYYLMGYYSTNTKLDGRFRKLTVRVKRPGVAVRARPGYLAPTEEEAAAARAVSASRDGASATPPELRRALDSLTALRGNVPLRLHAGSGPTSMSITSELDAATVKSAEWQQGGRGRVVIEHERGAAPPIERELRFEPGQRSVTLVETSASAFPPGRYIVRLSVTATGGALPLQATSDLRVPDETALLGNGMALRRGPATGLQYLATADARFQRTERIRFEVPKLAPDAVVSGRVLNRTAQALPLVVFAQRTARREAATVAHRRRPDACAARPRRIRAGTHGRKGWQERDRRVRVSDCSVTGARRQSTVDRRPLTTPR